MDTALDRVKREGSELQERISKLCSFMETENYLGLSPANRILLEMQLKSMKEYRDILDVRVELMEKEAK